MQAVVLAGGLGTRLWPLTKDIPKPLIPVRGVPYLEYQLRTFVEQSITNVVILNGYLGDQIEDYFGDGSRLGLTIQYSREREQVGTAGALRDARTLLDPLFLVVYGDSYLPINYLAVSRRLDASDALGLIVVYRDTTGETSVPPNVALDSAGHVIQYQKETSDNVELKYIEAGVLAFRREVLDLIPSRGSVSLEREIYPQLIAQRKLVGFPTAERFYDIGTPERLRLFEGFLP